MAGIGLSMGLDYAVGYLTKQYNLVIDIFNFDEKRNFKVSESYGYNETIEEGGFQVAEIPKMVTPGLPLCRPMFPPFPLTAMSYR